MAEGYQYQYEKWMSEGLGVSFLKEGRKWDSENDVADVVARIEACPNLKYLELEGNTLGVPAAKAIGKALYSKRELEAALWKDLFTGRLKDEIPQAFNFLFAGIDMSAGRLQRLDLSDNAIGPVGMVGLGPFFKSVSSFSLKELILNNNGFGPEGGSSLANALLECLRLSKNSRGPIFQLKVFVCGRNRLENKAGKRLAEFFKQVETLEEVHMPQNGIYKEGIAAIADALKCNRNMKILNLNDNTIRKEGITQLASAISEMKNLQDLSLTDCLLKGNGAMQIINALKECRSMRKLNLSGNEISKSSGKQAAEALRGLSSLEELNFSYNSLGTEGSEFVTNMLSKVNVIIEDDDGTEDEDEPSEEEEVEEEDEEENSEAEESTNVTNVYEDISSADEQSTPAEITLKKSAIDTFLKTPSEMNFTLLDKDSPFEALKLHLSDTANQEITYEQQCVNQALRISVYLHEQLLSDKPVSDKLVNVFMDLMSEALKSWTPNGFTSYLLTVTGVFRPECGTGVRQDIFQLKDLTLYCLCKWMTERKVSRNIPFYLAVIGRNLIKERAQQLGVAEKSLSNFISVSETAYSRALKMKCNNTVLATCLGNAASA